jgi:hypothetical protein
MRRLISALVVLATFATPSVGVAQTITLRADLSFLSAWQTFGSLQIRRVDDDGDGVFDSFVLRASRSLVIDGSESSEVITEPFFALVRVGNTVCIEDWVRPMRIADASLKTGHVELAKGTHAQDVLSVQDGSVVTEIRFDRHRCQ